MSLPETRQDLSGLSRILVQGFRYHVCVCMGTSALPRWKRLGSSGCSEFQILLSVFLRLISPQNAYGRRTKREPTQLDLDFSWVGFCFVFVSVLRMRFMFIDVISGVDLIPAWAPVPSF